MSNKKIISVYLVLMIILSTAFYSVSAVTPKRDYVPRLEAPSETNKYYYDGNYNLFEKYDLGMPNCTAYAYGRAYELLVARPNLCPFNAGEWWSFNKEFDFYEYGQTPRVGAIACWDKFDNDQGHVAVVEEVTSDTVTLSESAYGGPNFFIEKMDRDDKNLGYSSSYRFLGYIYLLDAEEPEPEPEPKPEPEPEPEPEQMENEVWVVDAQAGLNFRSGSGTSFEIVGFIPRKSIIVVTQIKEADGYIWGKTTYNGVTGWCALSYCTKMGLLGDADQNGKVSIRDCVVLQMYMSGSYELSSDVLLFSDTSQDGKITIVDLLLIQKKLNNLK